MSENVNECSPIIIFPMGVICVVTNPSKPRASNGTATLIITGGTPPYNIVWENGNNTVSITNLSEGSYSATITDYYGDFTVHTTCVLVSPTTTTTTLPPTPMCFALVSEAFSFYQCTTSVFGYYNGKPYYQLFLGDCETPVNLYVWWNNTTMRWEFSDELGGGELYQYNENPSNFPISNEEYPWVIVFPQFEIPYSTLGECEPLYDFCMTISYIVFVEKQSSEVGFLIHFIPNGSQSWISDDYSLTITWDNINNYWVVNGIDVTVINTNPSYPPLSGWQVLGVDGSVTVNEGECQNNDNLTINASVNYKGCDYSCLNSITITGGGGVPPYQYSIDGGVTWVGSPIFQGICNGLYSPQIKDSLGTIVASDNITVIGTPC